MLRRVPYFAGVPTDRLRDLTTHLVERRYRRGQLIAPEGHTSQGLYFVLSGRVTAVTPSLRGRQQVLGTWGPGRTFGEIEAFHGGPCPGVARATVSSHVGLIPREELHRLMAQYPQPALAALQLFATRLRKFTRVVEDLSLRPVAARVAGLLVDLARGDAAIVEDAPTLVPRLTHQQVAALVGSVRAVVQRELKDMERAGAIRLGRGTIEILDIGELKRWKQG